jgi:two-component system LytT family response regulator
MQPESKLLKTVIVDDEPSGRESLYKYLTEFSKGYDVVGVASSADEGEEMILKFKPDLVFSDIEMPIRSGLEMLSSVIDKHSFLIVLTTAHEQYAIKAINRFDIVGYLLKPIDMDEFHGISRKIFEKAGQDTFKRSTVQSGSTDSKSSIIFLPKLGGKEAIKAEDIIYCKASNNYTEIYLIGKTQKVISKTLKATESMLSDSPFFFRVHDSYLVNYRFIQEFKNEGEAGMLNLQEGHSIDVSKRKKADFLQFLRANGVKFD